MAMLSIDRLSNNDAIHFCREYLLSQKFKFHSNAQHHTNAIEIQFARDHSVELPGHKNVRWAFSDQTLRFYDTDKDPAEQIGEYRFTLAKRKFEGTFVNSVSTIVGVHHSADFDL